MENKKQRVLAYDMAKVIEHEELANIAGGSEFGSTKHTVRISGSSLQGLDWMDDFSPDF